MPHPGPHQPAPGGHQDHRPRSHRAVRKCVANIPERMRPRRAGWALPTTRWYASHARPGGCR
eukprot:1155473-Pyramimonas_sp.AAC.1